MPPPQHRPPPPEQSARERIAARRAVRRRPRRQTLIAVVAAVSLVVLCAIGIVWRRADQTLATIQQRDPRRPSLATPVPGALTSVANSDTSNVAPVAGLPDALKAPINILLIGVDKRPNTDEGVRSDTLILVHLNPQGPWASVLSIPRDSLVQIPHLGWSKINAAYGYGYTNAADLYGAGTEPDAGGGALAAETVEQFLQVHVDYTAQVDFQGFAQLVDASGGVVVDVQRPLFDAEYPTDNYGVERVYIPAGLQVLNGRDALIYARSRHSSTDFDRSARQQVVLRALLSQIKQRGVLENATVLPQWAEVLAQNVRTTLPVRDFSMLQGLATLASEMDTSRIVQLSINPNDVAIDSENGSDITWNANDVRSLVARWQAGPQAAAETALVQVLNGAGVEGVAGQVTTFLSGKGFTLGEPANAGRVFEHTTIIDYTGKPETRQRLADTLGIDPRYVETQPGPDAPPQSYGADIAVIVGQDYQASWQSP